MVACLAYAIQVLPPSECHGAGPGARGLDTGQEARGIGGDAHFLC